MKKEKVKVPPFEYKLNKRTAFHQVALAKLPQIGAFNVQEWKF